jgi:hypothetical protein
MTQADVVLSTPRTDSFLFRLSERELDRRDVTADVLEELLIPDTAAVADAIVQDCAIRALRSGPRSGDRPGAAPSAPTSKPPGGAAFAFRTGSNSSKYQQADHHYDHQPDDCRPQVLEKGAHQHAPSAHPCGAAAANPN